jgi:hypothetical protein
MFSIEAITARIARDPQLAMGRAVISPEPLVARVLSAKKCFERNEML